MEFSPKQRLTEAPMTDFPQVSCAMLRPFPVRQGLQSER
jgi:hypothetical protein